MPSLTEFGSATSLPFEALKQIAEQHIRNPESNVFKTFVQRLADKYNAHSKTMGSEPGVRNKTRVYIPYALSSADKYRANQNFRAFTLVCVAPARVSAPMARTISLLMSEYLITLLPKSDRKAMVFGYQLKPLVLRSREWLHLCVPGGDPFVQSEFIRDDRELVRIYDTQTARNKRPTPALANYISAKSKGFCTNPAKCEHQANVAVAMLDRTDTNFRQLCHYMSQHGTKLLLFALPAHKFMEEGIDGPFDELDGYIAHRDGKVYIMYKGDMEWQYAVDKYNYMELVARTRYVFHGMTYIKEFVSRRSGFAVYKITASAGEHLDPVEPYRSWVDPEYRDHYMLHVPVLRQYGSMHNPGHYDVKPTLIRKAVIDSVLDSVMTADDKMVDIALRRLFSKAYMCVTGGQITKYETPLTLHQVFVALWLIYTKAYAQKFRSGAVASTIAPLAREAMRSAEAPLSVLLRVAAQRVGVGACKSVMSAVTAKLRDYNFAIESRNDTELPAYFEAAGFTLYPQDGTSVNGTNTWTPHGSGPAYGFTPHLPGVFVGESDMILNIRYAMLSGELPVAKPTFMDRSAGVYVGVKNYFSAITDFDPEGEIHEESDGDGSWQEDSTPSSGWVDAEYREITPVKVSDSMRRINVAQIQVRKVDDLESYTPQADALVRKVLDGFDVPCETEAPIIYNAYLAPPVSLDVIPGARSISPIEDMRKAISLLFPESFKMDTTYIEAERLYNPSHIVAKVSHMKVDVSRLEGLKPGSAFLPVLRGHVLPNIKDNQPNVLATLAKRNADTPYHLSPIGVETRWKQVEQAMFDVFFVPHAKEWLAKQPKIVPTDRSIREWVAKQAAGKIEKLLNYEDEFSVLNMMFDTDNLNLMLKSKLKPEMDSSYNTALKLPQTVQYDRSGRSVAVLSPAFRDIVKREQFVLRPHIMIMQRKNIDDCVNFLNMFDHRPDHRGRRRYVEIDQTMFDKSQVREIAELYLKYLKVMGLEEEFVEFVERMFKRNVSSMKSGVKLGLRDQNVSGAAFTLHRNNSVSLIVVAIFLSRIKDQVEFVMMMGDDVTIAVRGEVDVTSWESEMTRFFNMSPKITMQEHGYICSQDIVHRPDGTTTLSRDIVKAALSFMQQDYQDDEKFSEMWESYRDGMKYLDDAHSQMYLEKALPERWAKTLANVTAEPFHLLLRAHLAISDDPKVFRQFFGEKKIQKVY